ncbi:hypothetical protein JX265_007237 [Neoarthrinium moseri]|uniref:Glycosyltransferase family 2 protein n=1 Tax=Neoarthrinium moseri TaxID=1658444 RepID=A0A9P9WJY4_9PEZI|nr:hypothetical protein JX265_007237 [Neoarthrinium moseri]
MSNSGSSKVWPFLLGVFCAWDAYEDWMRQYYTNKYTPWSLPSENDRIFDESDVSLIVPTIDFDESVKRCFRVWLTNKPLEIIFVTTVDLEKSLRVLIADVDPGSTNIKFLTVEHVNKRDQLIKGVNESSGRILALVDDDAFWKSDMTLLNLLAPFQDDDVGLVGGPIKSYIPEHRRRPEIITHWEVAAFRMRERRDGGMKCAFAADGGINFCVSGVTMLLRSEILRDSEFQDAFSKETWMGKRTNSGDDSFITRWVLFYHQLDHHMHRLNAGLLDYQNGNMPMNPGIRPKKWKLAIQHTAAAVVETSLRSDSGFSSQLKRWYRSGLRLRLTCLLFEPGWHAMRIQTPYMARKMVEGMLTPILSWVRLIAQLKSFKAAPRLASVIFLFNTYLYLKDIAGFFQKFPWCKRKWWAVVLMDRLYFFSDIYCWLTLGEESWETRPHTNKDFSNTTDLGASSAVKKSWITTPDVDEHSLGSKQAADYFSSPSRVGFTEPHNPENFMRGASSDVMRGAASSAVTDDSTNSLLCDAFKPDVSGRAQRIPEESSVNRLGDFRRKLTTSDITRNITNEHDNGSVYQLQTATYGEPIDWTVSDG